MDYDPARPWVRQPCDDDLTWPLFQAFLALPLPRRLEGLGKPQVTWDVIQRVAWENGWTLRAAAWDRHLDQIRTETAERVTAEDSAARARRQARAAKKLTRLAELELDRLLTEAERLGTTGGILGLVPVGVLPRMIAHGIRAERMALGETTDEIQSTGPDLSKLTVEQLRTLRELQEKVTT